MAYPLAPGKGLLVAAALNVAVSVVAWSRGWSRYGYGYGGLVYHLDEWLLPTLLACVLTSVVGLVMLLHPRYRAFGFGVCGGALLVALAAGCWAFLYTIAAAGS